MIKTGFAIFIMALFFAAGCAVKPESSVMPVEWEFSSEETVTYYYLRAQDEMVRGRFFESASLLAKAIEISPRPFLYIEMARSYWGGHDRDMAFKSMEQAVDAFPEEPALYFFLVELFLADNRDKEAVEVLEEYRRMAPDDLDVYQDLASFYIEMNDFPKALDLLEQVPDDRKTPEILYYMGRASSELGDRKKAVEFLRRAVDKNPVLFQAWAELAFIYESQRDYLHAEEIYEKLLSIGDRNPDLILRVIELNLKLNDPDKAMLFLERGPVDVQFHLDVTYQFISNSFYSHALDILQGIMHRGAYPPTVYFYLALIAYQGWSDPDQALEYLSNIPEDDYYHLQALSFSIQIYFEQKQYGEALELASLGREIHPSESRFVLFESIILEILGDYSQALESINSGLEKWPTETDLLFRKGSVWSKKGDKDRSMEIMEEIIVIDQDHHEALNYLGYTLAEENRDLERALVLIKRALSLDPANGYYIDSLAWVYYMQGEFDQAWKEIQRAVEFVDDDPTIWEHYADIALAMEIHDLAVYGYEMALEYDSDDADKIKVKMDTLRDRFLKH